jgi:hypothetical protein
MIHADALDCNATEQQNTDHAISLSTAEVSIRLALKDVEQRVKNMLEVVHQAHDKRETSLEAALQQLATNAHVQD